MDQCPIECRRCPSSTEFQNRDLDLPAKLLDVDSVAAQQPRDFVSCAVTSRSQITFGGAPRSTLSR
jgi:hypothetical protein